MFKGDSMRFLFLPRILFLSLSRLIESIKKEYTKGTDILRCYTCTACCEVFSRRLKVILNGKKPRASADDSKKIVPL
jgi:hypothetical protein